ncbi:zinc finger BED domain-containing protein RICESLEEPER 4-like [Dioscorea cayenensis subsp. rotundata]|uniref:Zinc finger BED domain-containing protein RICESLEEPER 4-like n=1 Tax=Dioscorea cayennensis subsp. rotundata TaxID=55577 RepID=A0AB40ARS8_DIOCR|nr:zinc finger BED domain-containing protein RICESLEEPER 4-like [Dioscorea cayenensis subsp. rotundata]
MSTPASIDESSANVSPIGSVGNFDNAVNEANNVEVNESPISVKDDEVEENPFAAKQRKKTSKVWDEFKEITLSDATKKAECIHCRHQLGLLKSGATTQFIRHLKVCVRRQLALKGQRQLTISTNLAKSKSVNAIQTWKYDQAKVRQVYAHMVLVHDLTFSFAEDEVFNHFMRTVSPNWERISRGLSKKDCISAYDIEKKKE